MTQDDGYRFLQDQMKMTSDSSKTKIASIIKSPQLLFLFSNLTKIPMFEDSKLINYNRIYAWRKLSHVG